MTDYRRYRINGGTYFFTVNLADRNRALLTEHIDTLRESFRVVKEVHPFEIDAIVVVPAHLHTIWTFCRTAMMILASAGGKLNRLFPEK